MPSEIEIIVHKLLYWYFSARAPPLARQGHSAAELHFLNDHVFPLTIFHGSCCHEPFSYKTHSSCCCQARHDLEQRELLALESRAAQQEVASQRLAAAHQEQLAQQAQAQLDELSTKVQFLCPLSWIH